MGEDLFYDLSGSLDVGGADYTPPAVDNSFGAPDLQPTSPTGNGFGTWVTGNASKILDYALSRDQNNMQLKTYKAGLLPAGAKYSNTTAGLLNNPLFLLGAAVVVVMMLKGKE